MRRTKRLADLMSSLGADPQTEWADVIIGGVCEDSRRVAPGELFVAIRGAAQDGADFAASAAARGAAAVICDRSLPLPVPCLVVSDTRRALAVLSARFFDEPTRALRTVGVTGTNGKTTVCHWIAHLLGRERTELVSTVENEARGLRAITTPSSPIVQRIARDAVDAGKENLVIEASSIGLDQRRLEAVAFDVAAFTNLTHDHFDLHNTQEAYAAAKAGLFRMLGPGGWAVVNADDPHADAMLAASGGESFRVGLNGPADLTASDIAQDADGTNFRLAYDGKTVPVRVLALGRHNAENAVVAAGAAICLGRSLQEIAERLRTAPAIPGRGTAFRDKRGTTAIVDFAHNPDALLRILETLRTSYDRIITVFGTPGGGERAKRQEMGEISGRLADVTILTSDNPKDERPESIIDEIALGVRQAGSEPRIRVDRAEAIRLAAEEAGARDVIVVAGKGHERYQIVRGEFVPYSDASVLGGLGFELILGARGRAEG